MHSGKTSARQEAVLTSRSAAETRQIGKRLGTLLRKADVVALTGSLGAGKTTLAQGIGAGAGLSRGDVVRSPSFVLIHEHAGRVPIAHVDLYRMESPRELAELGIEEYLGGDWVVLIEWAERAEHLVPEEHLRVEIEAVETYPGTAGIHNVKSPRNDIRPRRIRMAATGTRYVRIVREFL